MNDKTSRGWKISAIVLMGLTAAMNVLGGAGTVCAAFLTKDFPPMWVFMDYQWLYQSLMIVTILIGIAGIWSTVKLTRGGEKVLYWALAILGIGTVLGGTQYIASMMIRGKGVPANVKFFANLVTLIFFLVIRYTKLSSKIDFSGSSSKTDKNMAGGLSAFISGFVVLSVFIWAGPSHTFMGESWVELYSTPILVSGTLLLVSGLGLILWSFYRIVKEKSIEINHTVT
jgi:hypothetical protein